MTALNEERAIELYEYAVDHPDGFTNIEATTELNWPNLSTFRAVARTLRLLFIDDSINLICEPNGIGPWTYRLVGTYDDAQLWARNRLLDSETRLGTIEAVSHSVVQATDGRSTDGRKARMIYNTVHYLRQQLEALDGA